jgi:hypothetical protein
MTEPMHPTDAPLTPPRDPPPVLLTRTWTGEPDRAVGDGVAVAGGRLRLLGRGPGVVTGHVVTTEPLRDAVVDTVVRVSGTSPAEGFGPFCRQTAPDRYLTWRMTTDRLLSISVMDGTETVLAAGTLAPGMVLHTDPGAHNRFTVVACGPALTLILNGLVVTSVLVDPRYAEGHAGVLLEHRAEHGSPQLDVEWFQARAILAG